MKRRAFIFGGMAAILASRRAPALCIAMRNGMTRPSAPTPPLPYDAEVEYLESTGTQYIDLGVVARGGLIISCRFKRSDTESSTAKLVYGGYSATSSIVGFGGVNTSGSFTWNPNALSASSNVVADTSWHTSELSTVVGNKYIKIDGTITATSSSSGSNTGSRTMYMFARNRNSATANVDFTDCSISSLSITDAESNVAIIDLFSVRFTNELGQSEGAMYDRVSGALFRNAGTGAFTIGPDK